MKSKSQPVHPPYWLYNIGLLETLSFCYGQKLYWFVSLNTNRLVYSDYFMRDTVPGFKKVKLT